MLLKIMAATDQPVFTLRRAPVPTDIKKIVLPIKMHRDTRQKAPIAADLAELFGAELHVIAVSTSKNKRDLERLKSYAKQVTNYFNARKLKCVSKTLVGDSLPNLTCNYAEAVDAELIIMMSSAIDKWNVFLGSYAQQMVNKTSIPLLSITPREKHIHGGIQHLWRIVNITDKKDHIRDTPEFQLRALMEALPFASWFRRGRR